MTIKLDWNGGSTDIDGYYVYRSETPMDGLNPPVPIATLAKTVKTWTDVNTPRGKLYYYRVSAYKGSEVAVTFERAMTYVPYTGPGEPELVMGDWEAGYFGEIPYNDLITGSVLIASISLGLSAPNLSAPTRWFKMAHMGKIIYIPDGGLGTVPWDRVYQAGLVFGDLDPALIPQNVKTQLTVIPQNKRILIGEDEFIIRLPRTRKDPLSTATDNLSKGGHEWDMIFAKLFITRTLTEFNQAKGFRSFIPAQGSVACWTADSSTGSGIGVITRVLATGNNASVDAYSASSWSTNTPQYLPVLELVL